MNPSDQTNGQSSAFIHQTPPQLRDTRVTARVLPKQDTDDREDDRKILDLAHLRFRQVSSNESRWRENAKLELNFISGSKGCHWTSEALQERRGRPSLEFDKIGPSIDQVVNEARQSPPEPRIAPVGGGADKKTAEILQGLIRNIENDSNADIAYLTAYEHAVAVGRGWWRVLFEYESDADFQQKILIKRIPNLFSVYVDPATDEFDYSDMRYAFITEDLDKDVFRELYPDSDASTMVDFQALGDSIKAEWFPKDVVRVAEYWWVETTESYIALMQDGRTIPWEEAAEETTDGQIPVSIRKVTKKQVKAAKLCGTEILKRWDHPGKWIPIVPCLGKEIIRDGKRELRGMVRPAMDANLSYDYMRSKQVEAVALTPIAPWLVAEGQIEGFEGLYADSNRKNINVLPYKTTDAAGNQVGPPIRNTLTPGIEAITEGVQYADQDCKTTLATWDPNLGAPSPDSSGRAILARQRQGDNAHFNYHDNLARSMRHTGRIILDLIPHVYSEARTISIYDPDGTMRSVPINQTMIEEGAQRIYNLTDGAARYDVVISSGPSYATRRQQGTDAFIQLFQAAPQLVGRALDIGIRMMDIPNADKIADRVRPPDIPNDEDQAPMPPQAMQQIQQMTQLNQALTAEVHKLSALIEKNVLKLESEERREIIRANAGIAEAALKAGSAEAQSLVDNEYAATKHRMDLLHEGIGIDQDAQRLEMDQQLNDAQIQALKNPQGGPSSTPNPSQGSPST